VLCDDGVACCRAWQLSDVLRQQPACFSLKKINIASKYIEVLDELPPRFRQVEILFLSNNSLRTVQGIQQFRSARVISLTNNVIDSFDEVDVLAAACPSLEVLALQGNPIATHPRYRSSVLQRIPWLRVLDSVVSRVPQRPGRTRC
jgi:Leucine-rich repeat (LRR) protein